MSKFVYLTVVCLVLAFFFENATAKKYHNIMILGQSAGKNIIKSGHKHHHDIIVFRRKRSSNSGLEVEDPQPPNNEQQQIDHNLRLLESAIGNVVKKLDAKDV